LFIQLKVLKVLTKNLADPVKCMDEKYRQLKLDNEKLLVKLAPCRADALGYLKCLGFVEEQQHVLRVMGAVNLIALQGALAEVSGVLDRLAAPASLTAPAVEKLSEKQKARMLLEEKERLEKEETRRRRKATAKLIQQDKYVRKHDDNWTSQPSAAVNKTGNAISTFRDRHGES
jgi:hypothetical protein